MRNRISTIQGDPDFTADFVDWKVFLDGKVQTNCISADIEAGLVVRYVTHELGERKGQLAKNYDGKLVEEIKSGVVMLVAPIKIEMSYQKEQKIVNIFISNTDLPRVVGFTGKKGAGKNTAAHALVQHGYREVAFADPIKVMISKLVEMRGVDFKRVVEMLHGSLKEVPQESLNGRTPREAMQTLGTEWGRCMVHPDIWIDTMRDRIRAETAPIVVTDVRFQNEVDLIHQMNGKVVRIVRDGTGHSDTHQSEAGETQADIILYNDSDIADLHRRVIDALTPSRFDQSELIENHKKNEVMDDNPSMLS